MEEERVVAAEISTEDQEFDVTLRPRMLTEFIGQASSKENLKIFVSAALARNEPLDHVLLSGPPGLGKTTLAGIIANELGVNFRITSGPMLERAGDLAAILSNLEERDVLFVDEIHRLNRTVEEVLYPAMEDFSLDIVIGKGPGARSVRIEIPRFTLVGATTRSGLLSAPLRDRFGVGIRLDYYPPEDLAQIIMRSAHILNVKIDGEATLELAKRSRGTPRIANRLLRRVRDYAQVKGDGTISLELCEHALRLFEVDGLGLDKIDQRILLTLIQKFNGMPVGLQTLSNSVGEETETIEEVYEPFLLQTGLIARTPRGRVPTEYAYRHLGIDIPASSPLFNPEVVDTSDRLF